MSGKVTTIDRSDTSLRSEDEDIMASSTGRPSVHTTSFHQQSFHATEASNLRNDSDSEDATVSADQERQVLLLMLLAQVCALHDPTPKTFTIHVVELFERGILDRESIHFLFELGLVPSISPNITSRLLTAEESAVHGNNDRSMESSETACASGIKTVHSGDDYSGTSAACEEIVNELALTTTNANSTTKLAAVFAASGDQRRSAEAYAIRATLAQYEQLQQNLSGEECDDDEEAGSKIKPWDAKHFPLSLSRYQREFEQVSLLASGSFGQVYHATRKMDGCDYAIKKVDFDATGYSNATIQEVVREVECLAKVSDHPNVVRYYTSWLEPSWMTGGQTVEPSTAASNSPSGSPSNFQQRRQQQRRLLLTNNLQEMIHPGSLSDEKAVKNRYLSSESFESSQTYENGAASFSRIWQRHRRFSFESGIDSSDQTWGSYQEQSLEELGRATFGDDDGESSSSILFMRKGHNPQDAPNHHGRSTDRPKKPAYRYQISLYIQMQLCHPASLADWIQERNSKVPEKNYQERVGPALEIFEQIVKGLAHVHEKGIIHRDLKPANIFASKNGQIIKIGDFGLSKQLLGINRNGENGDSQPAESKSSPRDAQNCDISGSYHDHWHNAKKGVMIPWPNDSKTAITQFRKQDQFLTMGIGTRSYAAPEQLQSKFYSTAADIFSLGLIFLELVCCFETEHERLHNFQKCRQQEGLQQWLMEQYSEIANIILACTQPDPANRPSAKHILEMLSRQLMKRAPSEGAPTGATAVVEHEPSPKGDVHNALLRRSLERRDLELEQHKKELAEKDKVIEKLRLEMERMKASSSDTRPTALL